jgi:hypothetical protein
MTKLFVIFPLLASIYSCGQISSNKNIDAKIKQDSVAYIQKCIDFIKQVKQPELSDINFILSDKPFSFDYFDCIQELLTDTFYTKDELKFIKDKKYLTLSKWTKAFFGNTKIVSSDTIKAIFKDNSKWWLYFNKNIGRSFSTFSVPIFLRNDTYCLFYSDNSCGGLCGRGRLTLYKREYNKWTEVKSYCDWIS